MTVFLTLLLIFIPLPIAASSVLELHYECGVCQARTTWLNSVMSGPKVLGYHLSMQPHYYSLARSNLPFLNQW